MTDDHEQHHHDDHHDHHEHVLSYPDAIAAFRADKDHFFRSQPGSPIPASERSSFTGLPYYPVDEGLVFDDLRLEPYDGDEPSHFQIPTSDGKLRPAKRAGVLRFQHAGQTLQLTGYTFDGDHGDHGDHDDHGDHGDHGDQGEGGEGGDLFVPFLDATSGTETYGAGRYLDLEPEDDGSYTLDFNQAYHPSCVYDPRYSCPLTPAENRLPVRIEAGERLPASESSAAGG